MKKETKPTYHANDGTIFTDPLAAATHDAAKIFEDISDGITSHRELSSKWLVIRDRLNILHDEYLSATMPIPYKVGVPLGIFWDTDKYSFVTEHGTVTGEPFKRIWIGRKDEFPTLPQADEPDSLTENGEAQLAPESFKMKLREDRPRFPGDDRI